MMILRRLVIAIPLSTHSPDSSFVEPSVFALLAQDPPRTAEFRQAIEEKVGADGFMLFGSMDFGALQTLVGQRRQAKQYVLGNPLIALRMVQHQVEMGLYVPLRVLIYEDAEGKTRLEYDRPSTLASRWNDANVLTVARELDAKLEQLAQTALQ